MRSAPRARGRRALPGALALLFAPLLCAAGCAYQLVSGGQLRPEPFHQIVDRTVRARGIAPEGEIRTGVIASAELPGLLRRALAAEWTGAEIRDYQEGLVTLGLWPADRDLEREFVAVYAEEVIGLYLPTERTLYLVDDPRTPWSLWVLSTLVRRDLERELILGHELVHFLQHQAFPELMEADPFWKSQDDVTAALQAALEGDALHYGFASLEIEPPAADELRLALEEEDRQRTHGALAEAPALLRLTLSFPYVHGYGLSLREGYALLAAPPASTEQVLHPDKRLEPFQAIDLAALRAALPAGCRAQFEDTLGELGLSVLLRDLGAPIEATAWEGWDGDRWVAVDCDGRRELVWLTAWDSEPDAAEFASSYGRIAAKVAGRAGMASPPTARVVGSEVWIATPGLVPLAADLGALARRARVVDLPGVRAHFAPARQQLPAGGHAAREALLDRHRRHPAEIARGRIRAEPVAPGDLADLDPR